MKKIEKFKALLTIKKELIRTWKIFQLVMASIDLAQHNTAQTKMRDGLI